MATIGDAIRENDSPVITDALRRVRHQGLMMERQKKSEARQRAEQAKKRQDQIDQENRLINRTMLRLRILFQKESNLSLTSEFGRAAYADIVKLSHLGALGCRSENRAELREMALSIADNVPEGLC
jgi:hypothetical protein